MCARLACRRHIRRALWWIPFATGVPLSALAQGLEEIVVTAQKREEALQDVPISVTAMTGEQLDALGFDDYTEITQQVPNLQLNTWSPKLTIFNIRGISQGNFNDNLEAPVAVYVDDAYVGSMNGISGQLFDLERVEVLRGPQGTLFGRNATGGLVHYLSRQASNPETNGYLEAEVGDFNRQSFEGAVGGALGDNVRARVAGRWAEADGYVESRDLPPFTGTGQDIGGVDGYAVRGTMQVDFSEKLEGNFWVKYSEDTNVPTGGYVFENCPFQVNDPTLCEVDVYGRAITLGGVIDLFGQPASPHDHYSDHRGTMNREQTNAAARFDYTTEGGVDFASITSYTSMDYNYDEDGDALPIPVLTFQTFVDYTQFSEELRFSGETETMRWQTGFYYLDMQIDGGTSVTGAPGFGQVVASGRLAAAGGDDSALTDPDTGPFNGFAGALSAQDYVLNSSNWSVFGQAEFDISDRSRFTAGLRWSQDNKDIDWILRFTDNFNPVPVVIDTSDGFAAVNPGADEIDYSDWAARLGLDFDLSDSTMLFAAVSRGIKGGNWAIGGSPNITPFTFQHAEEVLWAYELGVKSDFDTYRINGSIYYYDYDDYQAFSLAGGGPTIYNSDATAYGGELEFFWSPSARWDVVLGFALSDSAVDQVFGPNAILSGTGVTGLPITDAEFPNAPAYSANYLVRRNWNAGTGSIGLQLDGALYDDQFLEVTNGSGTVQEGYDVLNVRLTYASGNGRFSASAWVENANDEIYKQYSLDLGELGVTTFYGPPRTYGVTARFSW
jgi:iron complex outermembrane receptor protein